MKNIIYSWLSKYYETDTDQIEQLLKNELATSFLLVWPIFEQSCFGGYMRRNDLCFFATRNTEHIDLKNYENAIKHFHNRYQNKQRFQSLQQRDRNGHEVIVLNTSYETLTDFEKTEFLVYVIYRFRNNIFHGNKGIRSWVNSTEEIKLCIECMTRMIDDVGLKHNQNDE